MLVELIDKVVVHQATASSYRCKNREQKVEVYFRLVGLLGGITDR